MLAFGLGLEPKPYWYQVVTLGEAHEGMGEAEQPAQGLQLRPQEGLLGAEQLVRGRSGHPLPSPP